MDFNKLVWLPNIQLKGSFLRWERKGDKRNIGWPLKSELLKSEDTSIKLYQMQIIESDSSPFNSRYLIFV